MFALSKRILYERLLLCFRQYLLLSTPVLHLQFHRTHIKINLNLTPPKLRVVHTIPYQHPIGLLKPLTISVAHTTHLRRPVLHSLHQQEEHLQHGGDGGGEY